MKLLVFEPHGDDALISLFGVLSDPANEIHLVTMAESRSSESLIEFFPNIYKVEYCELDQIPWENRLTTPLLVRQWVKEGLNSYREQLALHLDNKTFQTLVEYYREDVCSRVTEEFDFILAPVGVIHPDHVLVNYAIGISVPDKKIIYYLDGYYSGFEYGKQIADDFAIRCNVANEFATSEDYERKLKIFKSAYPTEHILLRCKDKVIFQKELLYARNRYEG